MLRIASVLVNPYAIDYRGGLWTGDIGREFDRLGVERCRQQDDVEATTLSVQWSYIRRPTKYGIYRPVPNGKVASTQVCHYRVY